VAAIRFLAPDTDAFVASVQRHVAEFQRETGHTADLKIIGSDLYFSNKIHPFLEGVGAADVYMSGPVLLWEHLAAGYVEPLDDYLRGAAGNYHPYPKRGNDSMNDQLPRVHRRHLPASCRGALSLHGSAHVKDRPRCVRASPSSRS